MDDPRVEFRKLTAEKLQDLGNYLLILFNGPLFISSITITDKAVTSTIGLFLLVILYFLSYWIFPKGDSEV